MSHLMPERCQGISERVLILGNGEETVDQVGVLPGEAVTELRGRRLKRGQVEFKDGVKAQHVRLSVLETVGDQMDAWVDARFLAVPMRYKVVGGRQVFSRKRRGRHDLLELAMIQKQEM